MRNTLDLQEKYTRITLAIHENYMRSTLELQKNYMRISRNYVRSTLELQKNYMRKYLSGCELTRPVVNSPVSGQIEVSLK